jgi:hypothetical protein
MKLGDVVQISAKAVEPHILGVLASEDLIAIHRVREKYRDIGR